MSKQKFFLICALLILALPHARAVDFPPLKAKIIAPNGLVRGEALIYHNYVELLDSTGKRQGAIGIVMVQGRQRLFVIRRDQERTLIGWAENYRLYNAENKLVGYYFWTPTRSYVYDPQMEKVGEAECLAYQGVCAAGIAGFLLGLL